MVTERTPTVWIRTIQVVVSPHFTSVNYLEQTVCNGDSAWNTKRWILQRNSKSKSNDTAACLTSPKRILRLINGQLHHVLWLYMQLFQSSRLFTHIWRVFRGDGIIIAMRANITKRLTKSRRYGFAIVLNIRTGPRIFIPNKKFILHI